MKNWKITVICIGLSLLILLPGVALSADFPEKAIKVVVPYKPGGGTDLAARLFAKYCRKHLPVEVVVTNITGGSGKVAESTVMKANPDGYTLLFQHQTIAISNSTGRSDYTWEAYTPIALPMQAYYAVVAAKDAPFSNLKELIAYSKANPRKITWGFAPLNSSQLMLFYLAAYSDLNVKDVTYLPKSGDKNRIVAMLQGNMVATNVTASSARPYLESNDIQIIGMASPKRLPGVDYPTLKEQGADAVLSFNYTLFAPKGTAPEKVKILADAAMKTIKDPEFIKEAQEQWIFPAELTGEEMIAFLKNDYAEIDRLCTEFGIKNAAKKK